MTKNGHTKRGTTILAAAVMAAVVLALTVAERPAGAAFPGSTGTIAFVSTRDGGTTSTG